MLKCYRLIGRVPMECPIEAFGEWFETADRGVALTDTRIYAVSTVFLGLDHNYSMRGPPILFETMVFERADCEREDAPLREEMGKRMVDFSESLSIMRRYATWGEAEEGHRRIVSEVLRIEIAAAHALDALVNRHA